MSLCDQIKPASVEYKRVCVCFSGGKDSCYNMMQCVSAGHTIVALANLMPHKHGKITVCSHDEIKHNALLL